MALTFELVTPEASAATIDADGSACRALLDARDRRREATAVGVAVS